MGKKIRSDRPAEKQGGRTADFLLWFLEKNYWGKFTSCGRVRPYRYALNQRKRRKRFSEPLLCADRSETETHGTQTFLPHYGNCKISSSNHRYLLIHLQYMVFQPCQKIVDQFIQGFLLAVIDFLQVHIV